MAELLTIRHHWQEWADPSWSWSCCTVDRPEQVGPAWYQALGANWPVVIDVHCDPSVPPIPPHTTFEQMKDAAQSLLKGDADRWQVLKEGLRAKAQEVIPRRDG